MTATFAAEAPSYITFSSPATEVAGTPVEVEITVRDVYANPAVATGVGFDMRVTRADTVVGVFAPVNHASLQGVKTVDLGNNTQVAGDYSMVFQTNGDTRSVDVTASGNVSLAVVPGDTATVDVSPPSDGTVDAPFTVVLICLDEYGNLVNENRDEYDGLTVIQTNSGEVGDISHAFNTTNGAAIIVVTVRVPGTVTFTVQAQGPVQQTTGSFVVASGDATKYALLDTADGSPTDPSVAGSVDNSIVVTVEARDQYNNVAERETRDVSLVLSGSATTQSGNNVVDIVAGRATVVVVDEVAEEITISLADTSNTGLNVDQADAIDVVRIFWGAPVSYAIRNPGSGVVRSNMVVTVEVQDQHGNVVGSEETDVTVTATGSADPSSQVVDIASGSGTATIRTTLEETLTLAIVDSAATGYNLDTREVTFTVSLVPDFLVAFLSATEVTVGQPVSISAKVADGQNEQLTVTGAIDSAVMVVTGVGRAPFTRAIDIINGQGATTFDTELVGTVQIQFTAPNNVGVLNSTIYEVLFVADVPVRFALDATHIDAVVEDVVDFTLIVYDQFSNLADATALGVNVSATGTVSGPGLIPGLDTSDPGYPGNPFSISFGSGVIAAFSVSTLESEQVTISLSSPSIGSVQGGIDVTSTATVWFAPGPSAILYFLTVPDGSVDDVHTATVILSDVHGNRKFGTALDINVVVSNGGGNSLSAHAPLVVPTSVTVLPLSLVDGAGTLTLPTIRIPSTVDLAIQSIAGLNQTSSERFEVVQGAAIRYVILPLTDGDPLDPTQRGSVDTNFSVSIEALDQYDNLAVFEEDDVTITTTSSTTRHVTGSSLIDIRGGLGSTVIADTTDETVTVGLADTEATGSSVVSTQDIRIYYGQTTQFAILPYLISTTCTSCQTPSTPTSAVISTFPPVYIAALDQYGNLVPLENQDVTIVVNASASTTQIVANSRDPSQLIDIVDGIGIAYVTDNDVENVLMSLQDSEGTGLDTTSTRVMSFISDVDEVTTSDSRNINLRLSNTELNEIKKLVGLATNSSNTFLAHLTDAMRDTSGNPLQELAPAVAMQVTGMGGYEFDVTPPTLVSFDLLMETGVPPLSLVLSFSETVNLTSLDPTMITIQSAASNPQFSYTLQSTTLPAGVTYDPVVTIELHENDLAAIYALHEVALPGTIVDGLARHPRNTYLSILRGTVYDMIQPVNLPLVAIDPQVGMQVSNHTLDIIKPIITGFNVNIDQATLRITFSEHIDPTGMDVSQITLQSHNDGSGTSRTLVGGEHSSAVSTVVDVNMTLDDTNAVKANPGLFTSTADSFMSVLPDLVPDLAENTAMAIESDNALQANAHLPDVTKVDLVAFDLNMSAGSITLSFSEPVNGTTMNLSKVILQNSAGQFPTSRYVLTTDASSDGEIFMEKTIILSDIDRHVLQSDPSLATNISTTFLSLEEVRLPITADVTDTLGNVVTISLAGPLSPIDITFDMNGNPTTPRDHSCEYSCILPVRTYTADTVPERMTAFQLDMDTGALLMNFSEPMNTGSFLVERVQLVSTTNTSLPYSSYTITEATFTPYSLKSGVMVISKADMDAIKAQVPPLCSVASVGQIDDSGDCFLYYDESPIEDNAGIPIRPRPISEALEVSLYTPDTTGPVLIDNGFLALDLNTGVITLSFSETVDVNTFSITDVTLRSSALSSAVSYVLTNGTMITVAHNTTIAFMISHDDLNNIKSATSICGTTTGCYVSLVSATVSDTANNALVDTVLEFPGQMVQVLTDDITAPELVSFDLNMNTGELALSFSESIDSRIASVDFTAITLQATGSSADRSYTLTTGDSASVYGPNIVLDLNAADMSAIKARNLATSGPEGQQDNTFLSITPSAFRDLAVTPNSVVAIGASAALTVSEFTADGTAPRMSRFTLDLNAPRGTLALTFNEPVSPDTFNVTGIVLQSVAGADVATTAHRLTGGDLIEASSINVATDFVYGTTTLTLTLTEADQTSLKTDLGLAVTRETTFIAIDSSTIKDTAMVPVQAILSSSAQPVSSLGVDTAYAIATQVDYDFELKTITVKFDDVMDMSTLRVQSLIVQNGPEVGAGYAVRLNTSSTVSDDGYVLVINMSFQDELDINRIVGLATEQSNSFLSLQSTAITDIDGRNTIALTAGMQVTSFTPDTTRPTVTSFDLDMSSGELTVDFSEAVNTSVWDPTAITIASAADATSAIQIPINGEQSHEFVENQTSVTFVLLKDDLDALKLNDGIATRSDNTFLFHGASLTVDMAATNNAVVPITAASAAPVTDITPDTVVPELLSFAVDMDAREVTLSFSEPVRVNTANISGKIGALLAATAAAAERQIFTGGTIISANGLEIVMSITTVDFNALVSNGLFASQAQSFLTVSSGFIEDMATNEVINSEILTSRSYNADDSTPSLVNFRVDMDARRLVLIFSETVSSASLVATGITVTNAGALATDEGSGDDASGAESGIEALSRMSRTLVGFTRIVPFFREEDWPTTTVVGKPCEEDCEVSSADFGFTAVAVYLTNSDFNNITAMVGLLDAENTSFCEVAAGTVRDRATNGNPNNTASPVPASSFVADSSSPSVVDFSVDMDQNMMIVTFSETVNLATFNADFITVQNRTTVAALSPNRRELTGATSAARIGLTSIEFALLNADVIAIDQGLLLFQSQGSSFLTVAADGVRDMNNNPLIEVANGAAISAGTFAVDSTNPTMVGVDIDLQTHKLTLSFDETVIADTLIIGSITVQADGLGTGLARPLTNSATSSINGPVIVIDLDLHDANYIKQFSFGTDSTFVSILSGAIKDAASVGNDVNAQPGSSAMQATSYVPDATPPVLQRFDLDLTTYLLTFTFSEIVDVTTLSFNDTLVLVSAAGSDEHSRTLIGGEPLITNVVGPLEMIFQVNLTRVDLDHINWNEQLAANNGNDLFASWSSELISDIRGNPVTARPLAGAMQVGTFEEDTTNPSVVSWSLDLTTEVLTIQFDETVDKALADPTQITLLNQVDISGASAYTLTGGVVLNVERYPDALLAYQYYTRLDVQMDIADLNELKRLDTLCTQQSSDCFISTTASVIGDMDVGANANQANAVLSTSAMPVYAFDPDTTRPTFVIFDGIDLNLGQVTMTFDETMDASSLDCTQVSLHPSHDSAANFTFGECGSVQVRDSTTIVFNISNDDMNALKFADTICTQKENCFVRLTENAIVDMAAASNNLVPVVVRAEFSLAERATAFQQDTIDPQVIEFDLDFNTNVLTLSFDETVRVNTFRAGRLTLQSALSSTSFHTMLSSTSQTNSNGLEILLDLSNEDIGFIFAVTALVVNAESTFITFTSNMVVDMNGNPVTARVNSVNALRVDDFQLSLSQPELLAFEIMDLSANPAMVQLSFSEAVEIDTIQLTRIRLQADAEAIGNVVFLSETSTVDYIYDPSNGFTDKTQIQITLSLSDQRNIKLDRTMINDRDTTYISAGAGAIKDKHGANLVEISSFSAMQVDRYETDITQPILLRCELNMNTGSLLLEFDDIVNSSTLDPSQIALQPLLGDNQVPTLFLTDAATPVNEPNYTIVLAMTNNADINMIKRYRAVGTQQNNTVVRLNENSFVDSFVPVPRSIVAITVEVDSFTPDITPPTLLWYNIDMDAGNLYLSFHETVDVDSMAVTQLTLQIDAGDEGSGADSSSHEFTLRGGSARGGDIENTPGRTANEFFIDFTVEDFDEIKRLSSVNTAEGGLGPAVPFATSTATTYLTIPSAFINDMNYNAIVSIDDGSAMMASNFAADTTPPELVQFDLDMNREHGLLTLTFSETVDFNTFNVQMLTIMSDSVDAADTAFTLRGGELLTQSSTIQMINLTKADMNIIKDNIGLATGRNDTYLLVEADAIQDMVGNSVLRADMVVNSYDQDRVRPFIVSFELDMNAMMLNMTFSQTVDPDTFDPVHIFLHASGSPGPSYTLTGGNFERVSLIRISLALSLADANAIKAIAGLADTAANTYLGVTEDMVSDFNGNKLVPISGAFTGAYTIDSTPPTLQNFELNMTSELLTLSFSETVNVASIDVGAFQLRSTAADDFSTMPLAAPVPGVGDVHNHRLSTSTITDRVNNRPVVMVTLSLADLNAIKSYLLLAAGATGVASTFMDVREQGLLDTSLSLAGNSSGNWIVPIAPANAIAAAVYYGDFINPQLLSIDLEMDEHSGECCLLPATVTLHFSESVLHGSFNPTSVTIVSEDATSSGADDGSTASYASYRLTGGTVTTTVNSPDISFTLSAPDVANIRNIPGLATAASTTYFAIDAGSDGLSDTNGMPIVVVDEYNPILVSTYDADFVRPRLNNFDLDLTAGILTFSFSEEVNGAALRLDTVQLQSDSSRVGTTHVLPIANNGTITPQVMSSVVQLAVSFEDMSLLKLDTGLCTSETTCFLSLTGAIPGTTETLGLSEDWVFNQVDAIQEASAMRVATFVEDTVQPRLLSYDVNMLTGTMLLTFSEVMEADSLDFDQLTVQDTRTSPVAHWHRLTGGTSTLADGLYFELNMTSVDANAIRFEPDLADTRTNSILTFPDGAMQDMNGNGVLAAITDVNATSPTSFTVDNAPPVLLTFDIDINAGTMLLSYDEPVNIDSVNVSAFGVQANGTGTSIPDFGSFFREAHRLRSSSTATAINSTAVLITLSADDLNEIKRLPVCTATLGVTDCFLSYSSNSVLDMEGHAVQVLVDSSNNLAPMRANSYVADITDPFIVPSGFLRFDLNTGEIALSFSETMNLDSVSALQVSLQTSFEAGVPADGLNTYTLTAVTVNNVDHDTVVTFEIGVSDLDEIKRDRLICETQSRCYITATTSFAADMSGNSLTAVPDMLPGQRVQNLVRDTTSPSLQSYDLDMDQATMTFSFSETVDASELNPTVVTFHRPSSIDAYTLTGGDKSNADFTVVILDLTSDDVASLKARNLATDNDDTLISFTDSFAVDMAYDPNFVSPVNASSALSVSRYTPDATPPRMVRFTLDLNAPRGSLDLTFNEPIAADTFNVSGIVLQSSATAVSSTVWHRLTGGNVTGAPSMYTDFVYGTTTLTLMLTEADQTSLKTDFGLAVTRETTFIAIDSSTVKDTTMVPLEAILSSAAQPVATLSVDTEHAVATQVDYDFELKTITVKFDDVMDMSTLRVRSITVQSDAAGTGLATSLSTSSTMSDDGYVLVINMSFQDELDINRIVGLATEQSNSFLSLLATALTDVGGRNTIALTAGMQVTSFTPDTTRPTVTSFDLDMSSGELTVDFSEAVNTSIFDATSIALASAADATSAIHVQLMGEQNHVFVQNQTSVTVRLLKEDLDALKLDDGIATGPQNLFMFHSIGQSTYERMTVSDAPSTSPTSTSPTYWPTSAPTSSEPTASPANSPSDSPIRAPTTTPTHYCAEDTNPSCPALFGANPEFCSQAFNRDLCPRSCCGTRPPTSMPTPSPTLFPTTAVPTSSPTESPSSHPSYTEPSTSPTSSPTWQTTTVDMFGNHIVPITSSSALGVNGFLADTVDPEIISFAVDMDEYRLYMSFTEPIRVSTASILNNIELQGGGSSYFLTAGSLRQTGTLLAEFDLSTDDMNYIKTVESLFDAPGTSALRLRSGFVLDMAGNQLALNAAIMAIDFAADSVSPTLLTYRLDLNHGTLLLNFDEPVNPESLNVSGNVAISNGEDPNGSGSGDVAEVVLTGSSTASAIGMQILVNLTFDDLSALKQRENLATGRDDSYLSFASTFISDMAGNAIVAIAPSAAQGASNYIDDTTRPELLSYWLDMATEPGIISFSFSEIVDVSSLRPEIIVLQQGPNTDRNANGTGWHALQQGTMLNATTFDQLTVTMQLTQHDYETLKLKHIGDNAATTYLSTEAGYVVDMAGEAASALVSGVDARPVDNLVIDTTKPRLQYFDVNMNLGTLGFGFSEPMDASTLNTGSVQLQNMRAP